jgi:3-methyladenine DNA glycosylase AlkD
MNADQVLQWLERRGSRRNVAGMARFGIRTSKAFGVSMATMRPLVRPLKGGHELAQELWASGWHEARILAALIDDPAAVTRRQMESWARDFDNWAICDTTCIHLFDRAPHAWPMLRKWSGARREFVRRAAFATAAGLAVHDRSAEDGAFIAILPLIESAAGDGRSMVAKAVNWALRQIGKRNLALNRNAIRVARSLRDAASPSARWVGSDAWRELTSVAVRKRLTRGAPARSRGDAGLY